LAKGAAMVGLKPSGGFVCLEKIQKANLDKSEGTYKLELVAKLVRRKRLVPFWFGTVEIHSGAFDTTIARDTAVFLSWSAEQSHYVASSEKRSGFVRALSDSQS
jgi:hypothetical protein